MIHVPRKKDMKGCWWVAYRRLGDLLVLVSFIGLLVIFVVFWSNVNPFGDVSWVAGLFVLFLVGLGVLCLIVGVCALLLQPKGD